MKKNHKPNTKRITAIPLVRPGDRMLFLSFILIFVLLISISYILSTNKIEQPMYNALPLADVSYPKILTSQQIGKTPAYTIAVSDVSESDKYDPAFAIADYETMLTAKISITNNGAINKDLYPANQFYVRSKDGLYSQLHPSLYIQEPLQAVMVEPGERTEGYVSFAVPKQLSSPLLYIDLGWDDSVPVVYDILK